MSRRVVVLGLDGGTWDVFDRFMAAGHMPHLAELAARGHDAVLMSTDPPITPVAWSSFATGTNPGKHGVFGFMSPRDDPGSYSPPPARSTTIRRPTLWRTASSAGLRTIILSVPLTYPAEPVNGYMVTGMFTPGVVAGCVHPPELLGRLAASGSLPKFQLDFTRRRERGRGDRELVRALSDGAREYFRDLDETQDLLLRAVRELSGEPWDLLVAVLIGTDRLQHVLWDEIEACGADSVSPMSERIAAFYRHTDEAIGEFARLAGEDGNLIIMSDHGFGRCDGRFAVGRWLIDHGYSVHSPRRLYGAARGAVRRLGLKQAAKKLLGRGASSSSIRSQFVPLDWGRTRAYFVSGTYGVRANLRGRECEGIVEPGPELEALLRELMDGLSSASDPATGKPIFTGARLSAEMYDGPETAWSPDIVLEPNPELGYALVSGDLSRPDLVLPSPKSRGSHRPEGMLLVSGSGVAASKARGVASIVDVAPTVMRLLGLADAHDIDGRVLTEAFESLPQAPAGDAAVGDGGGGPDRGPGYSESEEEAVRERLRNLGYID